MSNAADKLAKAARTAVTYCDFVRDGTADIDHGAEQEVVAALAAYESESEMRRLEREVIERSLAWYTMSRSICSPGVENYWMRYYATREWAEDAVARLVAAREKP